MHRFSKNFFLLLWLATLIGACTPAATATLSPTEPPPTATATSLPSAAPLPTNTLDPAATEAPSATPTKRPTPVPLFTRVGEGPIIPVEPGTLRSRYVEPGAAIFHEGKFHVFFNAFNRWPGHVDIGYAASEDGTTWEIHPDPLFSSETLMVDYAPFSLYVSSVLVEDDGTWALYFYTWDESLVSAPGVIGRATAPGPLGPWMADPKPLLTPEVTEGHWDSFAVRHPAVVKTNEGYFMYYAGTDIPGVPVPQNDVDQIGLATSLDGQIWTKYDDPTTTDKLYSRSDPVLSPNEDSIKWDSRNAQRPAAALTPEGFVLFYRSNKGNIGSGNSTAYGYAISEDGIHWTRGERNPVMRAGLFRAGPDMYATNMLYHDGMYYLLAEIGTGQRTEVFFATGDLP